MEFAKETETQTQPSLKEDNQNDDEELRLAPDTLDILKGLLKEKNVEIEKEGEEGVKEGLANLFGTVSDSDDDEVTTLIESYTRKGESANPKVLNLNLVGQRHSLWGNRLWNAARYLADTFDNASFEMSGKTTLELGSGAGLPSLICALRGAESVVITDYASTVDTALVDNIQKNIDMLRPYFPEGTSVHAQGLIWGYPPEPILNCLEPSGERKFDLIILADLLFNHSEHTKLLETCDACLSDNGVIWVTYGHHVPQKAHKDMKFFELAVAEPFNFISEKIDEQQWRDIIEEHDGLDQARGVVYTYHLRRRKNNDS